ncbi:TPA: hypothetical protein ACP4ZD_005181, partial [Klebsiella pneumoniae]
KKKEKQQQEQQQGAGGNAKQQKQNSSKPAATQQQPTLSNGDELDRKGMSKSQIEELEALDEVHAAQRKAAAETEKATAGFGVVISDNIQGGKPQEPEPSAPAARGGSFKDRLKMKKTEFAQKAEAEEEAQDHERKRRRGLGLLH